MVKVALPQRVARQDADYNQHAQPEGHQEDQYQEEGGNYWTSIWRTFFLYVADHRSQGAISDDEFYGESADVAINACHAHTFMGMQ